MIRQDIRNHTRQIFINRKSMLNSMEQAVRHLDPLHVLKRGYSITTHKGKIVKDSKGLKGGMTIKTLLFNGTVTSIVQPEKEAKEHGKKQGTELLPGFE
jgi:exodeoxyribonuclease VII large subunit